MRVRRLKSPPEPTVVPWTYELPPEGGGSAGLEGYAVRGPAGERVGSVFVVLRRGSDLYLGVRRGFVTRRDVRLVPWADVSYIDHATETVGIAVGGEDLAGLPRLARDRGADRDDAEAVRVTDALDAGAGDTATRVVRGDGRVLGAFALGALGFLAFLVPFLFASRPQWQASDYVLFALPVLVLLAAVATALAFLRRDRARQ